MSISGYRGDDDDDLPVWLRDDTEKFEPLGYDDEDEASVDLPRFALRPNLRPSPSLAAADPRLLKALAGAERAVARIDARATALPAHLRHALIVRMAYREASGWLAHVDQWMHPHVLAMWSLGLTGNIVSWGKHSPSGPISSLTSVDYTEGQEPRAEPLDDHKLKLACLLIRQLVWLVERGERLLLDSPEVVVDALRPIGGADANLASGSLGDTLTALRTVFETQPVLLGVIDAGNAWLALDFGHDDEQRDLRAGLVMAMFAHEDQRLRWVPLPLWATIEGQKLRRTTSPFGTTGRNIIDLLDMIHEGALAALRDLEWLISLDKRAEKLFTKLTKRSILRPAFYAVLGQPVITPKGLANSLGVSHKAAIDALMKLNDEGLLQQITSRKSFRVFALPT